MSRHIQSSGRNANASHLQHVARPTNSPNNERLSAPLTKKMLATQRPALEAISNVVVLPNGLYQSAYHSRIFL